MSNLEECAHCGQYIPEGTVGYIDWRGSHRLPVVWNLGVSARPLGSKHRGIKRAIFDAAYGHVNGFPLTAIVYFVLTRSLAPRRFTSLAFKWEYRQNLRRRALAEVTR